MLYYLKSQNYKSVFLTTYLGFWEIGNMSNKWDMGNKRI